jgi:hypothetical protein
MPRPAESGPTSAHDRLRVALHGKAAHRLAMELVLAGEAIVEAAAGEPVWFIMSSIDTWSKPLRLKTRALGMRARVRASSSTV